MENRWQKKTLILGTTQQVFVETFIFFKISFHKRLMIVMTLNK